MKFFSKNELLGVGLIFLIISIVTGYNLSIAIRRARDVQRRSDIGAIKNAIDKYEEDFGFYPPSEGGKIKACKGDNFDDVVTGLEDVEEFDQKVLVDAMRACEWGQDSLRDLFDDSYPAYMNILPLDPKTGEGKSYLYLSSGNHYQLYSYLEGGESEEGYGEGIVARGLPCGNEVCSFGKTVGETPLDRSIEEYEVELVEKAKGN